MPDIPAGVRQVAEHLRLVLHTEIVREPPAPEVDLLWKVAQLLDGVSGAIEYGANDPDELHAEQWMSAAARASYIADLALGIAGDKLTLTQASSLVQSNDQYLMMVGPPAGNAVAFSGSVEVTRTSGEVGAIRRRATVAVASDEGRALTMINQDAGSPTPTAHTPATLLRTAHHLQRLGSAVGAAIDSDGPTGDTDARN